MADVKWIKITTDIFDDEKILLIESLPDSYAIITAWFKLLCLAGKINNSGVFMLNDSIAYTDKMLATIFRMKESTVQLALQTFEQFGMIKMIDNVITIPNWGKHQSLDQLEKKRISQREYMREYREKQKLLSCNANCKTNSNANVSRSEEDKNKKENKKEIKKNKEPVWSDSPELNDAIKSFIEFRKGIKKPMTDRAIELLLKNLDKMSNSVSVQIEILNQSIVNGWTGIYELKHNSNHQKQQTNDRKYCEPVNNQNDLDFIDK